MPHSPWLSAKRRVIGPRFVPRRNAALTACFAPSPAANAKTDEGRPAIATSLPRRDGGRLILLDAGANVDCRPEILADLLGWAADPHEVGLSVSHSGYQKHSGYLVGESDNCGSGWR